MGFCNYCNSPLNLHCLDEAHLATGAKSNCPEDEHHWRPFLSLSLSFSMPVHLTWSVPVQRNPGVLIHLPIPQQHSFNLPGKKKAL